MHCIISNKAVLQLTGEDRLTFLQGQITADVSTLNQGESGMGCLCSAKGKTWAILTIFAEDDRYLLVTDSGCLDNTLRELRKYAVFSKVDIQEVSESFHLLGLMSPTIPPTVSAALQQTAQTDTLPSAHWQTSQIIQNSDVTWMTSFTIPENRFLVLTAKNSPVSEAITALPQSPLSQWDAQHIQAGIPQLNAQQSEEYIPQMMNLQALNAISFTKGCYMGQEVVARTKYLGKNKRAGCILVSAESVTVAPGDTLELQLGENWRRIGKCLYCATDNQHTWVFAVLPNDLETDAVIRLQGIASSRFTLMPLPYALDDKKTAQ